MSTTDAPRLAAVEDAAVVTEVVLDAAPAKVWHALTEPEIVADWLGASGFAPTPGSRFAIPREADRPAIGCEVLTAEPPHRLSYSWRETGQREERDGNREAGRDSIVTFELSPAGPDKTRLRIVHQVVASLASRPRPLTARRSLSRMPATNPARAAPMRLAA